MAVQPPGPRSIDVPDATPPCGSELSYFTFEDRGQPTDPVAAGYESP